MQINANYSVNGVPYDNKRKQNNIPQFSTECAVQECILICLYLTKKDRIFSLMKMTKTDLVKKPTTL
mgnify:CR=1 FL=1